MKKLLKDKKIRLLLIALIAITVIAIVIAFAINLTSDKTLSYEEIETNLLNSGKRYFESNEKLLPKNDYASAEVTDKTLMSKGYLKDFSESLEEGVSCKGTVTVIKTANEYSYYAKLDCGNSYKTSLLSDYIKKDLTTDSKVAGLHSVMQVDPEDENGEIKEFFVYRGDSVNNFVKIGDYNWRIIKLDSRGRIMLIEYDADNSITWDDRYNTELGKYSGINNYRISRVYEYLLGNYKDVDSYPYSKMYLTTHNACVGTRTEDDVSTNGSSECADILEDQYFSLLPTYDFMNASLSPYCTTVGKDECSNYNYLAEDKGSWWTATALPGDTSRAYLVYYGVAVHEEVKESARIKSVMYLNSSIRYVSGTGSYDDPYIIE